MLAKRIKYHTLFISFFLFLILFLGVYIYHSVEGWSYLDSTYFLVITATTIGYGDLTPKTDIGKIITILYSFIGIASAFYLISLITSKKVIKKLRNFEEVILHKNKN